MDGWIVDIKEGRIKLRNVIMSLIASSIITFLRKTVLKKYYILCELKHLSNNRKINQ